MNCDLRDNLNSMKTIIQKELFDNQDTKYKEFCIKLTPGFDDDYFIGVRNPISKGIASKHYKANDYHDFFNCLPHQYYEENNVHAYIISNIKDYDIAIKEINKFLPYVNNWATCDIMKPKAFIRNKDKLIKEIKKWIKSKKIYTVRFGIEMLMNFYLDDDFNESHLELVSKIRSDEYYINMMIAWYFATALAKHYKETLPYIKEHKLDNYTNNKTIQKAIESYRISTSQKECLRKYKMPINGTKIGR